MAYHHCTALVLHCMDYRFVQAIADHMESLTLAGSYDDVSVAGSCQPLSRPMDADGKEYILRQITISKDLHMIRKVVLINHQGCGAYPAFDDPQSERVQHEADLKKARQVIEEQFPDLDVLLFFVTIEEKGTKRTIGFERVS